MERCCILCAQVLVATDVPRAVRVDAPADAPRYLHVRCLLRVLEAVPAGDGPPADQTADADDSTAGLLPRDW